MTEQPLRILYIAVTRTGSNGITSYILSSLKSMHGTVRGDLVMIAEPAQAVRGQIEALGGRVFHLPMRNRNPFRYVRELGNIIRDGGYDAVHANGNSCTLFVEMLAARRAGACVRIAHAHNTSCRQKALHAFLRPFFDRSYTAAAACGRAAGRFLFHDRPFTVLRNGIDTERFSFSAPAREEARRELGAEDRFMILHAGGFNEYKNQRFLLEPFAGARQKDSRLLLVFAGDGPLYENVKEEAARLGLDGTAVRFLGRRADVERLLAGADLFVLPSLYEGFPISLIEAQTSGIRCLVSETVTEDASILECVRRLPLKPEAWEDAMLDAARTDAPDRGAGENAVRTAGYDQKDTAKDLFEYYGDLLKGSLKKLFIVTRNMAGGGCERVLSQLVNRFDRQGTDCTVLTEYRHDSVFPLNAGVKLVPLIEKDSCSGRDVFRIFWNLRRLVRKEKPDVVLAMPDMVNVWTALFLAGTSVPVVISERNDPARFPSGKWKRALRLPAYRFVKGIVFQTEQQKEFFPDRIRRKGIVLDNPMELGRFEEPFAGVRGKTVVTAARFAPQKNLGMLVRAFGTFRETHPDWKLILYGEGPERKKLEELAGSERGRSVLLPGETRTLLDDIREAGMFVLTSDFEGMPNALMEAMASGLPCVSTDCPAGGPASLIRSGENGILIPVGDEAALTDAMQDIADDAGRAAELGRNAARIRERLDADIVAERWKKYLIGKSKRKKQ